MIIVNVKSTWPLVVKGLLTSAEATLGRWYQIPHASIEQYGDAIAGVYRGRIVSVFDIRDHTRDADNRVTFTGPSSSRWAHLIGMVTPDPWLPGQGRPVKYHDTALMPAPLGGAA